MHMGRDTMASTKYSYDDYTIGWVCALPNEQAAAMFMLDERHEELPNPSGDYNAYTLGSIGKHKVVIAGLPKGRYGNTSSATVATRMVSTFPNIKFGLMVGIGGGIPQKTRLGDVVISCPTATEPGVVQWDMGKAEGGGRFRRTGSLAPPPTSLLTALSKFEADHMASRAKMLGYLDDLRWMSNVRKSFVKSDALKDVLYQSGYNHVQGDDCAHCDPAMAVEREAREDDLMIHFGLIASGNQVIKDAILRDKLYRKFDENLLCVEMEAAGLMNDFPCIIIRGICDYADSHKNKKWQDYAAAVAAACAKAYLTVVPAGEVDKLQRVQVSITPDVFKGAKNLMTGIWDKQSIFAASTTTGPPDGTQPADTDGIPKLAPGTAPLKQTDSGVKSTEDHHPDSKPKEHGPGSNSPMQPYLESWLREASSSLAKMVQEGQVEAAMSNILMGLNQLHIPQKGRSTPPGVHSSNNPQTPPMSPQGGNPLDIEDNGCAEDPRGLTSRRSSGVPAQSLPAYRYRDASTQTWPMQEEPRNPPLARSQTYPVATRTNYASASQAPAQALAQIFPPPSSQATPYTKHGTNAYDGDNVSLQQNYYPMQTSRPPAFRGHPVPVDHHGSFYPQTHDARVNTRGQSLHDGLQFAYANGNRTSTDFQMHPSYSGMPTNVANAQQHVSGNFNQGRGYGPVEWNHGNPVQNPMARGHRQASYPQYHQYAPDPGYDACNCDDCHEDFSEY
ncbi:purine and uridine phosphorylase [Trichoderma novae-zelandiae]